MEYFWIIWAILAIISLIYGLSITVGMGWAMFILDLLGQSVTTDYANAQYHGPASRDQSQRNQGKIAIIMSLVFALLAYTGLY